jgi:hypothetical protein
MKNRKLLNDVLKGLLVAAAVVVAGPHLGFAQGDLDSSVEQLTQTELKFVPDVVNACFYIGGAAFTGSGLLKLKAYADSPTNNPLGQGLGRVSVGAGLLALPYMSSAVISTFLLGNSTTKYQTFGVVN